MKGNNESMREFLKLSDLLDKYEYYDNAIENLNKLKRKLMRYQNITSAEILTEIIPELERPLLMDNIQSIDGAIREMRSKRHYIMTELSNFEM